MSTHEFASSPFVLRRRDSGKDFETIIRKRPSAFAAVDDCAENRCVRKRVASISENFAERCSSPPRCFALRPNYSMLDVPLAPKRAAHIMRPKMSFEQIHIRNECMAAFSGAAAHVNCRDKSSHFEILRCMETVGNSAVGSWPAEVRRDVPASSNMKAAATANCP
jgi:hypothetical protein